MKSRKFLLGVGIVVVLIIGAAAAYMFVGKASAGADILAGTARVYTYTVEDSATDFGFIEVDFTKGSREPWYANGFIDANGDGIFADEEWVVKNQHANVQKGYKNRFSFILSEDLKTSETENLPVRFSLSSRKAVTIQEISEKDARIFDAVRETVAVQEQFGLNVPGALEDLKRGVQVAYAQGHDFDLGVEGSVPDLTGGPMDCFAIATANNLISMATQNGKRSDLPDDPQELIEELKQDMQWNNGIVNRNFMPGKAAFVERYGLPIETREILRPTTDDLEDAFSNGDAVEISTTMLRSKSGKANTGHVFTGIGAYQDGDEAGISVHDPATPQGADVYELSATGGDKPYLMVPYPMWDGIVIIDAIYIQTWTEESSTGAEKSTGTQLEEKTEDISIGGGSVLKEGEDHPNLDATFAHVKPGEYSEIYSVVTGLTPGEEVEVWLYGDTPDGRKKTGVADANGTVHHTWRITSYGVYDVGFFSADGWSLKATVVVE